MKKSFLNEIASDKESREVTKTFSNFLYGYTKMKSITESSDELSLQNRLILFIEDNQQLRDPINSVKKTLFKHWRKGEYSSTLAEKAWGRLVTESAKLYSEDLGKEPRLWEVLFSDVELNHITETLERGFYEDLKKGNVNMEELFNE
jgi:hypothetical protein